MIALRTAAARCVVDHDDRDGARLLAEDRLRDAGADAALHDGDLAGDTAGW